MARDYYKILGVDKKASAGRDQEGVPQARAPVPPGPQPGRREGGGALQGDLRGLRRPLGPRQAQEVRPRRLALRRRRLAFGGGAAGGSDAGGFGDILSDLFGQATRRPLRRRRPRTKPAAEKGPRPRDGGLDLLRPGGRRARRCPSRSTTHTPCPTCRGTGAEPGTEPIVCPVCQGRGVESQGQGLFSITRPCSRCNGSGTVIEQPVPHLPRRGPPARAQALQGQHPRGRQGRLAHPAGRQGRGRAARRPVRRPLRHHARGGVAGLRSARATTSRSRSRSRSSRRCAAPRSRCRRSTGPRRCGSSPARGTGRSSGCAARARRGSTAAAAATSTTASSSTSRATLSDGAARGRRRPRPSHERQPARARPARRRGVAGAAR